MDEESLWKEYIAFNADKFASEREKGGHPADAVLGIIRAPDEFHARDTASAVFPDLKVFVRDSNQAEDEYVAAGEKIGYLNTSQAHRH